MLDDDEVDAVVGGLSADTAAIRRMIEERQAAMANAPKIEIPVNATKLLDRPANPSWDSAG